MKRSEIKAGGEYVTVANVLVRVEDVDNGWAIVQSFGENPEWVEKKVYGKRHMGQGVFQAYQSNPDIRVWVLGVYDEDGYSGYDVPHKDVVNPRDLDHPKSKHAEVMKARKAEHISLVKQQKSITSALKKAGLSKARVNIDRNEVTVNLNALLGALKIEV